MADPGGDLYDERVSRPGAPYDPEAFDRETVVFDDPRARRQIAFAEGAE